MKPTPFRSPGEIECWGHRGASAYLPENTSVPILIPPSRPSLIAYDRLASFRAAILEGADGIESGLYTSLLSRYLARS